jgi:nucleotide-binding universal stress UspA family protein
VIGQSLLGGTVYRVMRSTPREVGVLIDRGLDQVRRVLLAFLGGDQDFHAMALCRRMLADAAVRLTVLHVTEPGRNPRSSVEATAALHFQEPGAGQVEFRVVDSESPADTVLTEARAGYDLLVVAMSRDFGLEERAFGVQRERLLGECPISVLVVRPEKNAAAV